ncbi:MAG: FecR domain-containing protein [Asticcacaulis sp.]|uniref:FecR family protein n=1 Tax=Asticcacaulis sp. TaxID=1872648 RepID=UPI0039E3FAF2
MVRNIIPLNRPEPDGKEETDAVWEAMGLLTVADFAAVERKSLAARRVMWSGLAACLVLGVLSVYALQRPDVYTSGIGETRRVALADGSHVTLNTGSRLEVRLSKHRRAVTLSRGEAFFEVAKTPDHAPFDVMAGRAHIVVTGTKFNVLRQAGATDIDLLEGHINVDSRGQNAAHLSAGQAVHVDGQGRLGPLGTARTAYVDGWLHGRVSFTATRLDQAVAEMNRYSPLRLKIADPALADMKVDGDFNAGDTQGFARALNALHAVSVRQEGQTLVLGG